MKLVKIFFLMLVAFGSHLQCADAQRATYGEACNRTRRCDSTASLTCDTSDTRVCVCAMPEKMIFDVLQGKCVTIAGEKCVYTAVEISDGSSEGETKKWREELACVSRASCSSNGFCTCNEGYFENFNGTCEEKHIHGDVCSMDSHCKSDLHLTCSKNGTCDCNVLTSYDWARQKCVGRVGSLCRDYPDCVENAECPSKQFRQVGDYRYGYYSTTQEEIDYTTETCSCNSGFSNTTDGHCLVSYGQPCNYRVMSKRCLPELICRGFKCTCKYEGFQNYEYATSTCKSSVGGPCTETRDDSCILNSECVVIENDQVNITVSLPHHRQCRCKKGFIEVNRGCELRYGEKCGPSDTCDSIAPLQCTEGSCQCNFLEYYDDKIKKCRGLEGATCSTESGKQYYCTDGATCDSYRNKTEARGLCNCKEPYLSAESGKCTLPETKELEKVTNTILPETSNTTYNIEPSMWDAVVAISVDSNEVKNSTDTTLSSMEVEMKNKMAI